MGKRYSREEIDQIQVLTDEGLTDAEIAMRLDRTEDGIRNIRHRMKLKAETRESIWSLKQERRTLDKQVQKLRLKLSSLQIRRKEISKALQIEEQTLYQKLYNALQRLKDYKPVLFQITLEEQIAKITVELAGSFLKWLVSD